MTARPHGFVVLQMLARYMQLLGLLRLVTINWDGHLSNVLVYLDFTSGTTTWMSLECSFRGVTNIPASVMRSVLVLLFPRKRSPDPGLPHMHVHRRSTCIATRHVFFTRLEAWSS
jgi:hypothetical protein